MNIGVLIYTHNRVDDAKINMEIVGNVWEKTEYFANIKIVHAFNGKKEWYPKKYLENNLVVIKNSWHFQGASDLIDAGIKAFQTKHKEVDYVVVLAADTWLIKPEFISSLLLKMKEEQKYLATCPWGIPERNDIRDVGMAVDFFIVDLKWATKHKMFPINYGVFYKKYEDLFLYQKAGTIMLEKLLLARYMKALGRQEDVPSGMTRRKSVEKMLRITEREPVHSHIDEQGNWIRNMYWSEMGLLTYHEALPKKKILENEKISTGENIKKLLTSKDLAYFNNGISRMKHNAN